MEEEEGSAGPSAPPESATERPAEDASDDDGSDDEDDADDGPEDEGLQIPVSHELVLEGHRKAVTAIALDNAGARLLTGGHDYAVKIFDFGGMKSDAKPFRTLEVEEGHPIVALSWSPSGEAFLAVTGSPQPKVYDREGKELGQFVRGDMYIRDQKNTKGHVSGCTGGQWHPSDSGDGTVRIWDMDQITQKTVIKPQLAKPGRMLVTAATYGSMGQTIAAGLMDGSIQLWDVRGKFGRSAAIEQVAVPAAQMVAKQDWNYVTGTNRVIRNAHASGSEITSLAYSRDGTRLLSRGGDDTLKAWDTRNLKQPLAVFEDLDTTFANTQVCFSPDETLALTGTSATRADADGSLVMFDWREQRLVRRLGVSGSVIAVQWHPRINQILVGSGDRKSGQARVLYSPSISQRGATLAVGRKPRPANPFDLEVAAALPIYNPNALPLYREPLPGQRKRKTAETEAVEDRLKHKPALGSKAPGVGAGGKLGSTGGTLLTQYVLKTHGLLKNPQDEDIRASILRHADKEDEFSRFTAAYQATQPNKIFAAEEEEEEEEEEAAK
ncbi:hypothetical protein QBZ16_002995 [Prototheca wickerhamii]|uniref:Uncharacterized protein n=1 Tax=Prototheca wickerhamii TaxID=3111 RepID=A0AAD9MHZ1_PROWI|nr:hypothetical protein QBZ16_002995 [Prototheca wickerhamii]